LYYNSGKGEVSREVEKRDRELAAISVQEWLEMLKGA